MPATTRKGDGNSPRSTRQSSRRASKRSATDEESPYDAGAAIGQDSPTSTDMTQSADLSSSNGRSQSNSASSTFTEPESTKAQGPNGALDTIEAPGPSTKRNKFLERNRMAASKCRLKKKEYVSDLEDTKKGLEHQNIDLQREFHDLVSEVGRIKGHLMAHATCNDQNIDKWIAVEAKEFVDNATERCNRQDSSGIVPGPSHQLDNMLMYHESSLSCFEPMEQGGGLVFTQAPPLDSSSTALDFPTVAFALPKTEPMDDVDPDVDLNYDHMPDSMFAPN